MQFIFIISLVVTLSVMITESLPTLDTVGSRNMDEGDILLGANTFNNNEKTIVKRQVVPDQTGPGRYGGTWSSKDGKTQAKTGVDFNNAPKLGWHADVNHEIHRSRDGKVRTEVYGGASQPFNQVGRTPDMYGGVRVRFR